MEKRRNTLDRWQRLRFGRRAASNPPEDKKNLEIESAQKRSSDKTERLRELTELLKVPRNSSNPGSAIGSHLKLVRSKTHMHPIACSTYGCRGGFQFINNFIKLIL